MWVVFVTQTHQQEHYHITNCCHILDLTPPVTELLQSTAIDEADSSHLIESLKSLIHFTRKNVDQFHNNCYKSMLELAKNLKLMRLNLALQQFKEIVPSESVSDYFKKVLTMPLLDYLTTQYTTYSGLVIIPSNDFYGS